MVARMARESDPSLNTACFPVTRSVATQRKEWADRQTIARLSKASVSRSISRLICWPAFSPPGKDQALAQTQQNRIGKCDLVFLSPKGQVFVGYRSAQNHIPILCLHQFVKLLRSFAAGVEASHQAAHAGAREVVDRNVVVFKPLQHADVRQSQRAAAFESHANFQPWLGRLGFLYRGRSRCVLRRAKDESNKRKISAGRLPRMENSLRTKQVSPRPRKHKWTVGASVSLVPGFTRRLPVGVCCRCASQERRVRFDPGG